MNFDDSPRKPGGNIFDLPTELHENATQCEEALLGAVVVDPSRIDVVSDLVAPEHFRDPDLGAAFELLCDCRAAGRPISDTIVLRNELGRAGLLDKLGGAAWIARIAGQAIPYNAQWYAAEIAELSRLRTLHLELLKTATHCCDPKARAATIAERIEAATQAAMIGEQSEIESLDAMLAATITEIDRARASGERLGLSTRLPTLDRETGGFFRGDLTILAARPSIGKSAFAMDLVARVAARGKRVLIVSLEMTSAQLVHRLLNRESGIPIRQIQNSDLTDAQRQEIERARGHVERLPIQFYIPRRATMQRIRARARVQLTREGMDLIVIDYLQLIEGDRQQSAYERTTGISRDLKTLALELNRPVLALSQLNRESAKQQSGGGSAVAREPRLEHLRDSGAIEQDADNVWLLHRENRDAKETALIIAKQRQGPVGKLQLAFDAQRMRFDEPEIGEHWKP